MGPIRDQRTMTGGRVHVTPEDVRTAWREQARTQGFMRRSSGLRTFALTETEVEVPVFIGNGRYCASCPNPECNGAAACWVENPKACCLDCGWVFRVVWPPARELEEAIAVLMRRPDPEHRNWRAGPANAEQTVAELKIENLAMGDPIVAGQAAAALPGPLELPRGARR